MSLVAYFYTFNKRKNSTKVVTNDDLRITSEITLKEPTSLHTPTIILAIGADDRSKALSVNYVKFNTAYYWIEDTTILNTNHFQFRCRIDLLATYKAEILATKAYILYSEQGSVELVDQRLGFTNNYTLRTWSLTLQNMIDKTDNYYYILQVTGENGLASGYVLSKNLMEQFSAELSNTDILTKLQEYFIYDVWSGINALYVTPINLSNFTEGEQIKVGNVTCSTYGYPITQDTVYTDTYEFDIGTHDDFRDSAILTTWLLYMPFVGWVQLSSDLMYNVNKLNIDISVCPMTGNIIYDINAAYYSSTESLQGLALYTGNCNSMTTISRTQQDYSKMVSGGITTIASVLTVTVAPELSAAAEVGASVGAASGIATTALGAQSTTQVNGGISMNTGLLGGTQVILHKIKHKTIMNPAEITSILGNPTYKCDLLSNYTGYVKTSNVSVSAIATSEELVEINNALNGGIYIE